MDILEAIKMRRSVRAYDPRPIPPDVLDRMKQALRFAPSACNYQPWRFIFVTDPELRIAVAKASMDQHWMAQAPIIVAGCGRPADAYKTMGGYGNSIDLDIAIALDHLTLAAVADGLGTCWIGAFDEAKVKKLLEVPKDVKIVAMTPLGYPASSDLIKPVTEQDRKSPDQVFATNSYAAL